MFLVITFVNSHRVIPVIITHNSITLTCILFHPSLEIVRCFDSIFYFLTVLMIMLWPSSIILDH